MKIRLLGTAAAEGWPALFCACETCKRARAAGGKNIRSRASLLIGDQHKIDFPPDIFYHQGVLNADHSRLRHLFISHSHQDHFDIEELAFLVTPFAHDNEPILNVYGSNQSMNKIKDAKKSMLRRANIETHALKPFEAVQAEGLVFTPIKAKHMQDEECFNYIVSDGEKSVLYTCDTGFYNDPTWEYLSSIKLDMLISECTNGTKHQSDGHTSFSDVLKIIERLRISGTADENLQVVLTHFSHNIEMLHEEFEEIASPHGIKIAYDGMRLDL